MTPEAEERPNSLRSETHRVDTGFGKVYVNLTTTDDGDLFEVFVNSGSSGGFVNSWCEAVGSLASIALRSGTDPEEIADVLTGIRAGRIEYDNGDVIFSIPDAVGIVIRRHLDGKPAESIRGKSLDEGLP